MSKTGQNLVAYGVGIFIFGLILNFRSLQVCRKDAAGRIFAFRAFKEVFASKPDIKEPAEKHGLINFLNRLYFYAVCGSFLFINSLVWIGPICIILSSIIVIFDVFR